MVVVNNITGNIIRDVGHENFPSFPCNLYVNISSQKQNNCLSVFYWEHCVLMLYFVA
jgi:hypothetical protein